ncbi:Ribonuclease H-like superfamily [Sesbania bispinosa]|nr:Ribonuclease H-like superfamily [Sesbania bispinosa]
MDSLPPPPKTIPPNVVPLNAESAKMLEPMKKTCDTKRLPVARRDGHPVEGLGRKVIDKLCETYGVLQNKNFSYDGEKSLFTVGSLPLNKEEFEVVLEEVSPRRVGRNESPDNTNDGDSKRMRRQSQSKIVKVEISYAAKSPTQAIENALSGDVYLFANPSFMTIQGIILILEVVFKVVVVSIQASELHKGGLSLNVDVSNTMVVKPGPVLDFLLQNQNVQQPNLIDWAKAKRMLKSLRIKANNIEYKITGLSEKPCRTQSFLLKHGRDANGEVQSSEITVYDYFKRHKKIELRYSADFPCINVGKPKRPSYFPVESLRNSRYGNYPMLRSSGINIEPNFIRVDGRVLQAPRLVVGQGENFFPRNGHWNFNNKKLVEPGKIELWAIVNFSARWHEFLSVNVVSSRCWPQISRYRAAVPTQSSKVEMIASLFKPVSDTEDEGIIRELLMDFYITSGKRKPENIIIFRNGVSETQFNQVLNIELDEIIKACKHLDEKWTPKFTLIVAQKRHHTRFFLFDYSENFLHIPNGTVIDRNICDPKNNDFYMYAHAGKIGTSRPTHYHVLHDEIGFDADDLQHVVHSLSYVC